MSKTGRPTVMTDKILRKLEYAIAFGATIKDACQIANISASTYYEYVAKNPDFSEYIDQLDGILTVFANRRICRALEKAPLDVGVTLAWRVLERQDAIQGHLCARCNKRPAMKTG